jgi:hypothetical protein
MSKLEPWQRYRKATPCPVCGGYGAYKPENRCKGFLKADGSGAYCSQVGNTGPRDDTWFESLGLFLYFHKYEGEGESQVGRRRHPLLALRSAGLQRKAARLKEAQRPPTARDFG